MIALQNIRICLNPWSSLHISTHDWRKRVSLPLLYPCVGFNITNCTRLLHDIHYKNLNWVTMVHIYRHLKLQIEIFGCQISTQCVVLVVKPSTSFFGTSQMKKQIPLLCYPFYNSSRVILIIFFVDAWKPILLIICLDFFTFSI